MRYVTDEFESAFVLLSKRLRDRFRFTLRYDQFDLWRPGELEVDRGDAATLAIGYEINSSLTAELEWLQIESNRDLWTIFYGQPDSNSRETMLRLGFRFNLFDSSG
jgi:hypothetical protein